MNIETIRHLFWECRHVQQFWNNVSNLLSDIHLDTNINFEIISFCIYKNKANVKTNVQNFIFIFIFMFAKYFIFKSKYLEEIPTFHKFKQCLIKRINIEQPIAHNKDKLDIHVTKWIPFLQHIELQQRPFQK